MKKKNQEQFFMALGLIVAFVLWTMAISHFDVQAVGPRNSSVGFASLNTFFHELTGVHTSIYDMTDWLGLVPIVIVLGFAMLGLVQWMSRKSLFKVDRSILVLGGFYMVVMLAYGFFEAFIINYRPVLIEGRLEASYPSSTTLLVMCVMPSTMIQLKGRIKNIAVRKVVNGIIFTFTIFMVAGRTISGVHWITDIIGGVILSSGLLMLYYAIAE